MTTIVFPGQGSQFVGMSKDFYDNFNVSREVFELTSDITKIDIKKIIFENQSDLLNQTQYTQLAIFCASLSIYKVLINEININNLDITCMLGHSLGEYSALASANIISFEDCARLLKIRGELMQKSFEPNLSGMAAIIGINCENVDKIITENNLEISIANDNSPQQVVISGIKKNLLNCEEIFKTHGAKKFIILNVSAAFHSNFMDIAQNKMTDFINNIVFRDSPISIISNYSAQISKNNKIIKENLTKQMSNRVRWVESINSLIETKETKIIEIGPGKVLTGLIRRITDNFDIKNIEKIHDIENLKNDL
tara:strand:+ start:57 stop:986 length:930 start_codon:yes stop_codon:yes gene_type:complete